MHSPELLAPAGDLEKLETALRFGADAVYAGGEAFGLRAQATNFDLDALARGVSLAHAAGRRFYLTLNAYLRPDEFSPLTNYLEALRPLAVDAYIVADPGVLATVRRVDPQRPLHLSTQAHTGNAAAVEFWRSQGVARVNLARELSLSELRAVRANTAAELEIFVHGAMCVAISGRCLLSAALTGRSANRGACTHPCRWGYALVEESRPGLPLALQEDERGAYLLNSRDLCLVERLPELLALGLDSFKIEGRMKSVYYVAAVTRIYRAALDAWRADPAGFRVDPAWRAELEKVSHRPYAEGFLDGFADPRLETVQGGYRRGYDFVGVVRDIAIDGRGWVEGRNRFKSGERLELLGPALRSACFEVGVGVDTEGFERRTMQPNSRTLLPLPAGAAVGDLLRRERPVEGDCSRCD